jgi:putative sterol carrier protein
VQYEFLSQEWIDAARAIGDEYRDRVPPVATPIRINLVVNEAPGDRTVEAHIDTTSGRPVMELGHLTEPDLTMSMDYATARAAFADADQALVMQAFMTGGIKVEGDMAKLLLMQAQQAQAGPLAAEVLARVKEMTAA